MSKLGNQVSLFTEGDYSTFADAIKSIDLDDCYRVNLKPIVNVDDRPYDEVKVWLDQLDVNEVILGRLATLYKRKHTPVAQPKVYGGITETLATGRSKVAMLAEDEVCDNVFSAATIAAMKSASKEYVQDSPKQKTRGISTNIPLNRATIHSAGHDISSIEDGIVPARGSKIFRTGVKTEIEDGYYGQLFPRSGLAFKLNILPAEGVIDSDYHDEIEVKLFNHGDTDFEVKAGDRIAQIVFLKYYTASNCRILSTGTHAGFGSSGMSVNVSSDVNTSTDVEVTTPEEVSEVFAGGCDTEYSDSSDCDCCGGGMFD